MTLANKVIEAIFLIKINIEMNIRLLVQYVSLSSPQVQPMLLENL